MGGRRGGECDRAIGASGTNGVDRSPVGGGGELRVGELGEAIRFRDGKGGRDWGVGGAIRSF